MTAIIDETCPSDGAKPIIPGLAGFYRCAGPFSYAFVRIVTAALILPGGIDKLFYGGVCRLNPQLARNVVRAIDVSGDVGKSVDRFVVALKIGRQKWKRSNTPFVLCKIGAFEVAVHAS